MTFLLIVLFLGMIDAQVEWKMFKHYFKFQINSVITMLTVRNSSWIILEWDDKKKRDE